MIVASSLDSSGRPVNPRFTFSPAEPQITVIVRVGKLSSNSALHFVWYLTSDDSDQKLFEQEVKVSSFEQAFSEGKNPGSFVEGNYKVVAKLEGQTQEVKFNISEQGRVSLDEQATHLLLVSDSGGSELSTVSSAQGPPTSGRSVDRKLNLSSCGRSPASRDY
jgi:hypothetical protein